MRYTQLRGKAKMSMKVGLTFACMNMKKLAKIMDKIHGNDPSSLRELLVSRINLAYI
jgi:hypothetical protein